MLKAVFFDLDDTLVNWEARDQDWQEYDRAHLRGVFDYVVGHLHPLPDFEAFVTEAQRRSENAWMQASRSLEAPHHGKVLLQALGALGVPPELLSAEVGEACLRAYQWEGLPGVTLYPDVLETLRFLRSKRLRLGIVTNAFQPMWMRERELENLGLSPELFECRVSSADVGYLKPHPAIFEHALRSLDIRPEEAVFVGDNPEADVAGAQSAGMYAVLRVVSTLPPMISGLIVPDAAINNLRDLPAVLEDWHPGWQNQQDGG
jgi:FMN phosphatase YigB (HAD superfamily)